MFQPENQKNPEPAGEGGRWVVYDVSREHEWLLVQCLETLELGSVRSPTQQEWRYACRASQQPFEWSDVDRIERHGTKSRLPFVIENLDGDACRCPQGRSGRLQPVPLEALYGEEWPMPADAFEIECVTQHAVCSRQLASTLDVWWQFNEGCEQESIDSVQQCVELAEQRGVHVPPGVVKACIKMASMSEEDFAAYRRNPSDFVWDPRTNDWKSVADADDDDRDAEDDEPDDDSDDGGGRDDGDEDRDDDDGDPGADAGDPPSGDLLEAQAYAEYVESQRADWQGRQYAGFE
ncbi:MAG: hypothetical protein K8S94_09185 [Planctomycetia bacterium]|nr:hypothetical protein [Planctomycetia bacterium]